MNPLNVFEYEQLARESLEPAYWDFFSGGSDDEITVHENRQAFQRIKFLPRVLRDVRTVKMETTVQGTGISSPLLIAPTAYHCLAHPDGECATARAASNSKTVMIVSTFASRSLEEIASSHRSGGFGERLISCSRPDGRVGSDGAVVPLWLQLYVYRDLGLTETLVQRAEAAGYQAIVLTVDVPRLGRRERDIRNAFKLPQTVRVANFDEALVSRTGYIPEPIVITWDIIAWLRSITSLPIILKGILAPSDALLALEHGVNGIIVSNHGGRQLDSTIASIDALYPITQAVTGRCEIYVDGGIRRGTDILKALALGARAVLVGRPVIWGLAVDGVAGVQHVLELLGNELALAMALAGCPDLEAMDRSLVVI
jgi:4-hydroxymandelate oxidase